MGVFQYFKAMFIASIFVLLCGVLWIGYKFVTTPLDVAAVAGANMPTPEQLGQNGQSLAALPGSEGQKALQKNVNKVFADVSHKMDEVSEHSDPGNSDYSQATDEDYSDFGEPSVDVERH